MKKTGEVWNNYYGGFPIYGMIFPGIGNKLFHNIESHNSEFLSPSKPVGKGGKWISADKWLENMKIWDKNKQHDLKYEIPWRIDCGRILSDEFMLKLLDVINKGGCLFGK